ncbi:MAG TPA: PEP-CTERM sorting domain-containing protein [Stellaceae bacterium]|nr:PEP-CTERM sorting domain-containing protein [Stellaceae bacterium]
MKLSIGFAALGTVLVVGATGAMADDITVTNIAMPYEEMLTIDSPISPTQGYVGQLVLTTSTGATIDAWCIDLFHDGSLGNQDSVYAIEPIVTNNDPNYSSGTPLTTTQIDEIAGLIAYGDNLLETDATDPTADPDQDSAAVQLAIWEVEYPTLSYSGASANLIDEANDIYGLAPSLMGSAVELEGLDGQQSYATLVPEPASMTLFGTALLGLIGRRRRRSPALPPEALITPA